MLQNPCRACGSGISLGSPYCPCCGLTVSSAAPIPLAAPPDVIGTSEHERATPNRALGDRTLAALAFLVCVVGVAGLELPVVGALDDSVEFAVADVPYVGGCLLLLFAVLAAFPVVDAVRGRLTFTPWLLVPALVGLVPLGLLELSLSYVPGGLDLLEPVAPGAVAALGVGPDVLLGADVAIIVVAMLAVMSRIRTRRAIRGAAAALGPAGASAFS